MSLKEKMTTVKMKAVKRAKAIWGACICAYTASLTTPAFAAQDPAATMKSGMNTLITIASLAIRFIGIFIVLWGVFEWGNAMQSNDASQMGHAGKRIAGGIIMVAGSFLAKVIVNAVIPGTMS